MLILYTEVAHPVKAEKIKLRSSLTSALIRHIKSNGLTQAQAGKLHGVTHPCISNLIHGKIDPFGLDMLVKMATAAGLRITLRIKKAAKLTWPAALPNDLTKQVLAILTQPLLCQRVLLYILSAPCSVFVDMRLDKNQANLCRPCPSN